MESKAKYATITRLVVLIVVAFLSWGVGFYFGYWTGAINDPGTNSWRANDAVQFFEGLGVGMGLFVLLLVSLLWHSHHSGVRASCEELTYRVDQLQRELMELRAAAERILDGGLPSKRT